MMCRVAWPDEILEQRSRGLAEATLALLSSAPLWRHRRVETISLLTPYLQRRRVSVDLTVPEELRDGLSLGEQWAVPVAWLSRRQLVEFDLRDREGRAVPLLLGAQTARVTEDVLLLAALRGGMSASDPDPEALELIAAAASNEHPPPHELVAQASGLGLGEEFASLVRASVHGFLLFAVVDDVSRRQVLKWQTDEARPATGFVVRSEVSIGEAASTHVELELPDFTEAASFRLFDDHTYPRGSPLAAADHRLDEALRGYEASRERPRLLLQAAPAERPFVRAEILVSPWEFVVPALAMTAVIAAVLWTGVATDVAAELTAPGAGLAGVATAVILSGFAALSGLVLRVEAHPYVRRLLGRSRGALGATALAVVAAVAPIGLQLGGDAIRVGWIAGGLLSLWAMAVLADDMLEHTSVGGRA
jgi:hypothetical protein